MYPVIGGLRLKNVIFFLKKRPSYLLDNQASPQMGQNLPQMGHFFDMRRLHLQPKKERLMYVQVGLACGIVLLAAMIAMQTVRYRRIMAKKNRCIIRRIREADMLQKEMEQIRIEKNVLEKMLETRTAISAKRHPEHEINNLKI